ncbi:MAG: hypothetical protein Q9180_004624 [Flavoplaca navasiana]
MSGKDFGGYKRIVQYFWDPEPRNDDLSDSPIWCLGQRYDAQSQKEPHTSKVDEGAHDTSNETTALNSVPQSDTQESEPAEAETRVPKPSNASRTEERAWPPEFLDDFESRIWMTYRSNFPNIRSSLTQPAGGSRRLHVRHRVGMYDTFGAMFVGKRTGNITAGERRDISLCSLRDELLTAAQIGDEACNSAKKGNCSVFLPTTRVLLSRYTSLWSTGLQLAASIRVSGLDHLRLQDAYSEFVFHALLAGD